MSASQRRSTGPGVGSVLARAVAIVRADLSIVGVVLVGNLVGVVPVIGGFANLVATGVATDWAHRALEDDMRRGTELAARLVYLFLGGIVAAIVIGVGLLLLVLPGIYLYVRLALFPAAVMVDGHGPLEGLSESWSRTSDNATTVFGVVAVLFLVTIVIAGALYVAMVGVRSPVGVDTTPYRLLLAFVGAPFAAVGAAAVAVLYDAFGPDHQEHLPPTRSGS